MTICVQIGLNRCDNRAQWTGPTIRRNGQTRGRREREMEIGIRKAKRHFGRDNFVFNFPPISSITKERFVKTGAFYRSEAFLWLGYIRQYPSR